MQVLVDTFFDNQPNGHGGNRRTAQIAKLVERANLEVVQFERTFLKTPRERYLAGLSAIANPKTYFFIAKHRLNVARSLTGLSFCGFQRKLYEQVLEKHTGSPVLLWEATKNYIAPYVAKEKGFKVCALPHNLESLVPNQAAFFESLSTEANALAKADIVFCISREETWFLRLSGANAHYLPYYPPKAIVDQLIEIRQARKTTSNDRFLIVGGAGNPPTRQGMIEQITWLKQLRQQIEFQVDIVGFKTESLTSYCDVNITVHGAVSTEQLSKFMTHAKAALVHQTPSSGALTRIPEMLVAGIPVIANRNACRSAFDYAGIHCYESIIELLNLMQQPLEVFEIPPPPIAAEKHFIDCLQKLANH
ncbi:glycosyltransferase family 1 protein [Leptolyngbya sp. NIES-2104]|uniref:glycosyltransferase family 1 protein n=1 Tax=Leptolyngbya sp. NIES-2104 TaxID=1552121 RepID=UPI0006EC922A|nr:glycosyltransferase family 1 protein [Leptolyngbya sp. NIES-2104]GAP97597.1 hypothetical protein NIES2104_41440 [Leptolyngbya sp. NIES-2104]